MDPRIRAAIERQATSRASLEDIHAAFERGRNVEAEQKRIDQKRISDGVQLEQQLGLHPESHSHSRRPQVGRHSKTGY